MRAYLVALFLLAVLIISETSAEKPRKHKKVRKHHKKPHTTEEPLESNPVASEEREIKENTDNNVFMDPCLRVRCGAGRVCEIDEVGEPQCVCIPTCPEQTEERRKVCTNHNETWTSDCAVYQHRCYCETGHKDCRGDEFRHIHIDYYGECKHMPDCTKEEMVDFPRRMRDWLYNIMRDLADRDELTPHYLQMEKEAETNMTRRWTNSAIWKFCDLDGNPPDKSVSRHELFPIRAPLMSLEHCIAPFLNSCDENNDHRINIKEWAKCLELDEDEIEDRCELINEEEE